MISTDAPVETKVKGKKKKEKPEAQEVQNEEIQENFLDEQEETEMPADRRDAKFSLFKLKKLVMENGQWEMHIEIEKTFSKFYIDYTVEMVVDLDVIDWRIEEKKKAKQNYEVQNQMDAFEDMKKKELEEYDHRIEALITERAERIAQCPKISFTAHVRGFSDKGTPTKIVFAIPDSVIPELNEKRNVMESYKIELIKNLNNE